MVYFPPRYRRPVVNTHFTYNSVINIGTSGNGGGCCGGHVHHHCGGGMSKGMGIAWGIGLLTSVLGGLFNKGGNSQQVMPPQYSGYNIGYNAGLFTPGTGMQGGYNTGYNMGLYGSQGLLGQYGAMQGQYGQQQTVLAAKGNELVAMIKDLGNDYSFTFGETEEVPQLTADGQNYSYKGKVFNTVTDLRNFIEQQEGLGCGKTKLPVTRTDVDSDSDTDVTDTPETVHEEDVTLDSNNDADNDADEVTTPPTVQKPKKKNDNKPPVATEPTPPAGGTTTSPIAPPTKKKDPNVVTQEDSKIMMAKLRGAFGDVPKGISINPDGTYNYDKEVIDARGNKSYIKYEKLNINGLKYIIDAEKNYGKATEQDSPESYNNFTNNDKDRMYNNGQLSITKQQISNTETLAAFMLKNNEWTSVELGKISKADFEKTFANMFEDNVKNSKSAISEEEFIKYHRDYERNAAKGDIKRDKERQKTETVEMTSADENQLRNLFKAMSNGTGKVTKDQYTNFMTQLFKENKGKVTRGDLDKFAAKWITKNTDDKNVPLKYDYGNKNINRYMDDIRNALRVYKANGETSYIATSRRDKIIEDIYNNAAPEERKLLEKYFKEEFNDDIAKYSNNWFTKNIALPLSS